MSRSLNYKELPWCPSYSVEEIVQIPTGSWRALRPVVDKEKCTRCRLCYWYCPDTSISMTDAGPEINYEYCKGCGICANECPAGAIEMVRE